ncbi:hypothetical protein [Candidatus Nitrosopumilus sediminis]|uniref:Uncharacterized protein n=1 Tax=Candidatus Nitrosopumilus sediminis TaxID=1229909 RepID=K0BBV0_9ARCH|nr:hypothetical protein [Candidatus Nitrosopumilus sediminis]AFS83748.1 hypothetical protein NSED_09800 [Candidatus Nitrosopumilus sediminis]
MKTLALFTIFVLVFGTLSTSLVSDAYAQNDPNILLRIAEQADKQIKNQLDRSYGDSVPSNIEDLYEKAHTAVESLENSLPDDVEQAREDFLTAMKLFQQISRMVSTYTTETKVSTSDVSDRDLKSELNRLHKYFQSLKSVSEKQKTGIELSEIQRLFILANEQIIADDTQGAIQTINEIKSLIISIKEHIRDYSSNSASDRVKEFILKQLERIQKVLDRADSETADLEKANSLIEEIEILISEDKISDAKKKFGELNKIVKIIKKSIR